MILGSVTVYRCDGTGCESIRIIPVEKEPEFTQAWHVGLKSHFCTTCKTHFRNQAAIVNDENAAQRLRAEVMKHAA